MKDVLHDMAWGNEKKNKKHERMRYRCTRIRKFKVQNVNNIKYKSIGTLTRCQWEHKTEKPLWKTINIFL